MASHGDCHTHVDALNHVAYRGQLYNGKPASLLTSRGSEWGGITAYATGIAGRTPARTSAPALIARIAASHEVEDIHVEQPAIEAVIASFYRRHGAAEG